MNRKSNLPKLAAIIAVCAVLFLTGSPSRGVEKNLEVETYSLGEYRSDTARAIDAYQQVINRMIDSQERTSTETLAQLRMVVSKLNKIDAKLARIEKAVVQPQKAGCKKGKDCAKAGDKCTCKKPSESAGKCQK